VKIKAYESASKIIGLGDQRDQVDVQAKAGGNAMILEVFQPLQFPLQARQGYI
jgi:hypothetical protein